MEANVKIDGVEYNYHVTKDGRVFSLNYHSTGEVKEMKLLTRKDGYRYICLHKDGKRKDVKISRLVALTYIPNPENKPEVDHINRCRTDNRVENLRWATSSEQNYNRKEMPKNNKKSKAVMCIETGVVYTSATEIKRRLNFNQGNISECCNGKRKTAHGYHWQYVNE